MPDTPFTDQQLRQLAEVVGAAVRDELGEAGLRLDDPDHVDASREDFRFLRKLRNSWDGAVTKIGNAVLISLIAIGGLIASSGFWAWLRTGGAK